MGFGVVCSWSHLFLYAILVAVQGCDAREIKKSGHDHHHHQAPTVFFHVEDLEAGKTLHLMLPKTMDAKARFLPRHQADSIPFSTKQLPEILDFFSFPPSSKGASIVRESLQDCERPALPGETKFCATSLEQMLDSTLVVFGLKPSDKVSNQVTLQGSRMIDDNDPERSTHLFQNFTVMEDPKEIEASMSVGCHIMPYPYALFFCHRQEGGTKLYKLLLRGRDTGDVVEAAGICHMDTSIWDPNHVSFRELGLKRGDPVCHIFPLHSNFLWVYNQKGAAAIE